MESSHSTRTHDSAGGADAHGESAPTRIRRTRHTKVVATIGPVTESMEELRKLFIAGADVLRLNFSHGTQEDHGRVMARIRELEREFDRPIGVIGDLQGPKLRVGTFSEGAIDLEPGMQIRLDLDPAPGDRTRVCLPHPEIIEALEPGHNLLLDDGKVQLKVVDKGSDYLVGEVISGTRLSNHKGFNVPDIVLPLSPLTEKDQADLRFALDQGVDWIALSFVQRPEDVEEARAIIGDRAAIMLKLEKPAAINHLDALIEGSDAIMVARGDLGVEMSIEDVPSLQKTIVRKSRMAGRPVIVATQMLESMISAPAPTRAEVSDVATAVYDGSDAVMLSAETAAGAHPSEAVGFMDRVVRRCEADPDYRRLMEGQRPTPEGTAADAITRAAHETAQTVGAVAIVTYTASGATTLRAARERSASPILAIATRAEIARRLALSYGVHAVFAPEDIDSFRSVVLKATAIALEHGLAKQGERLVITAGVPFGQSGTTNILRILEIGSEPE
ncbi:MAG: pyruvate kinase [Halofilum sp. (in: g-proteobacteria)]